MTASTPSRCTTSASAGPANDVFISSTSAPIRLAAISASTKPRWLRAMMPMTFGAAPAATSGWGWPLRKSCRPAARASARWSISRQVSVPSSSTRPGRSGQRCAAAANPDVVPMFSRCIAAGIRRYLSGRMGASKRARPIVATMPSVSASRSVMAIAGLAQHREPAFAGEFVEGTLHHVPDVSVDLVDVGVLAELGDDVERRQHLHDDLCRQRHVDRQDGRQPEREAERNGQDLDAHQLVEPQQPGHPLAAGQVYLALLPTDRDGGNDRNTRSQCGTDVTRAAVEVDLVLREGRAVHVVVAAGEDDNPAS